MRMSEPDLAWDRPARCREVVLQALARLSDGDTDAATLHRARTHLRRLQACLELAGEDRRAQSIARCVARVSKLRTLQAFARYLKRHGAPRSDRKAVKRRLRAARARLDRTHAYAAIERIVRRQALPQVPADPAWMAERMQAARDGHADALRRLTAEAGAKPRRKTLHRLRLLIKSIRYQEEWALDHPFAQPGLIRRLKHAQTVLGDYEDLFQFRKLARSLDLRSSSAIEKAWRRVRARARALPARLIDYLGMTASSRIRLVGATPESGRVAGTPA
jgi:CHAD domain-containing protein